MKKTNLEEILADRLQEGHLLELFERQVRFRAGSDRKWRFDFYSQPHLLAIEVEGGTFRSGRHSRGVGMLYDMEKYNTATLHGIRVLRFDSTMILPMRRHKKIGKKKRLRALEGSALDTIRRALLSSGYRVQPEGFEIELDVPFVKKPRK